MCLVTSYQITVEQADNETFAVNHFFSPTLDHTWSVLALRLMRLMVSQEKPGVLTNT